MPAIEAFKAGFERVWSPHADERVFKALPPREIPKGKTCLLLPLAGSGLPRGWRGDWEFKSWWLFDEVGRRRLPIINMSGGTEVGACFLSANVLQGLKPCSVGGPSLGMAKFLAPSSRGLYPCLLLLLHIPRISHLIF